MKHVQIYRPYGGGIIRMTDEEADQCVKAGRGLFVSKEKYRKWLKKEGK